MIRSVLRCALVAASTLVPVSIASADQYPVQTPSGTKVAHTRLAPVIMHRLSPPFWGKHVYAPRGRR